MNRRLYMFLALLLLAAGAQAQKPFAEGVIVYRVKLVTPGQPAVQGVYTFMVKGAEIRKELKLGNGYQDVVIMDCSSSKVYSLQTNGGKKYAVQLNMAEMLKKQEAYAGYTLRNETANNKEIAGYASYKGNINYKDGSDMPIVYTKEWSPAQPVTFERFPGATFLPMMFDYKDENNISMEFNVEQITPGPVETGMFRIPPDYKMISYAEYKQLSR